MARFGFRRTVGKGPLKMTLTHRGVTTSLGAGGARIYSSPSSRAADRRRGNRRYAVTDTGEEIELVGLWATLKNIVKRIIVGTILSLLAIAIVIAICTYYAGMWRK